MEESAPELPRASRVSSVKIAFLHPDLGLGGAERLVVDAAVGLQRLGHKVTMFTTYHDPKRCFPETVDGTLKVVTFGAWIPRNLCGFFHIVFAILRMCYCAVRMLLCCCQKAKAAPYDVIFVDQVSACIPVIRILSPRSRVIFYCHFPDKLLAVPPDSWGKKGAKTKVSCCKRLYRLPFDCVEEQTTRLAHAVLVNSRFTQEMFGKHFRSISTVPQILYPAIRMDESSSSFSRPYLSLSDADKERVCRVKILRRLVSDSSPDALESGSFGLGYGFVSINRFERKKDHALAVKAFIELKTLLPASEFSKCVLVLAGGYDSRLAENVSVVSELERLVSDSGLDDDQVVIIKSFSDDEKFVLFHFARAVLYTPQNEHFGIVPIEAMCCSTPVICCNSGGPLESVKDRQTGYLVEPTATAWASVMLELVSMKEEEVRGIGRAGKRRIKEKFSLEAFSEELERVVGRLLWKRDGRGKVLSHSDTESESDVEENASEEGEEEEGEKMED